MGLRWDFKGSGGTFGAQVGLFGAKFDFLKNSWVFERICWSTVVFLVFFRPGLNFNCNFSRGQGFSGFFALDSGRHSGGKRRKQWRRLRRRRRWRTAEGRAHPLALVRRTSIFSHVGTLSTAGRAITNHERGEVDRAIAWLNES